LQEIGFQQSQINECVFYHDDVIYIVYIDDGVIFGTDDDTLTLIIRQLKNTGINIEDQEHPADYIGVNIKKTCDCSYEFTQWALVDAIINGVNNGNSYTKPVLTNVSLQLHAFRDSPKFNGSFTTAEPWAS
jgi:hypothetical protein